jgi:uncharacterized membrane-anchored protein
VGPVTSVATEPGRPATTLPAPTVWFWVTVVLLAGMSEAAADWATRQIDTVFVGAGALVVLLAVLGIQLVVQRPRSWLYWSVVGLAGIVGSLTTDVLHLRGMGDPTVTVAFIAVTAVVLGVWHLADATIAPDSVTTLHQQLFWWCSVGSIFALGTAAAELTASDLNLGYARSTLVFAVAIAVVVVLHRWWRVGPVVAFWLLYTFARPLGSSLGHWLSSGRKGIGLGPDVTTCALLLAAVLVVAAGTRVARVRA